MRFKRSGNVAMVNLGEYVTKLFDRLTEGSHVKHVQVAYSGWSPEPRNCHQNVTDWVEHDPTSKVVRGWLILDKNYEGCCEFIAHSVVQNSDGTLMDITPNAWGRLVGLPFIAHQGLESEYENIITDAGASLIRRYYDGRHEIMETN